MNPERVPDTWGHGSAYERYVGRWSRRVAPVFLTWLGIPPGRRWLDVGCGTGALCSAIADACSPASLDGVEPSEGFLTTATANLAGRARLQRGTADAIPLSDESADVVVSGLVLNFLPDHTAAIAEMTRVAANGGTIGAYVWDYTDKMELMRYFWDAAAELDPAAAALDESPRFAVCHPDALLALFSSGALTGTEVTAIDVPTPFVDFDDYWNPFLGGQGPAPAYAMSLDEPARIRLRERLRSSLPVRSDGSIPLIARAWAVRATVRREPVLTISA